MQNKDISNEVDSIETTTKQISPDEASQNLEQSTGQIVSGSVSNMSLITNNQLSQSNQQQPLKITQTHPNQELTTPTPIGSLPNSSSALDMNPQINQSDPTLTSVHYQQQHQHSQQYQYPHNDIDAAYQRLQRFKQNPPSWFVGSQPQHQQRPRNHHYNSRYNKYNNNKNDNDFPINHIILITVIKPHYPITCDLIQQLCSTYGKVNRIVIFKKNGVQVMVEFDDIRSAQGAKTLLQGCDLYEGCCTLRVEYAKPTRLNVHKNDSESYDYTNPDLGSASVVGRGALHLNSSEHGQIDHNSRNHQASSRVNAYMPNSMPIHSGRDRDHVRLGTTDDRTNDGRNSTIRVHGSQNDQSHHFQADSQNIKQSSTVPNQVGAHLGSPSYPLSQHNTIPVTSNGGTEPVDTFQDGAYNRPRSDTTGGAEYMTSGDFVNSGQCIGHNVPHQYNMLGRTENHPHNQAHHQQHHHHNHHHHRGNMTGGNGGPAETNHNHSMNYDLPPVEYTNSVLSGPLPRGPVMMVYGLNPERINCDLIFNLFCLYGNVVRVKFLRSKAGCAMVQMGDVISVYRCVSSLNKFPLFGSEMQISYSKQAFLHDVIQPFALPDGTPSFKDFMGNKNNRFKNPEVASKNRILPPSSVLHFFNAPLGISEDEMNQFFKQTSHEPISIKVFTPRAKNAKSYSGLATFRDPAEATEALVLCNHISMPKAGAPHPYILRLCYSPPTYC